MFPWDTTYDDTRIWLNITNRCGIICANKHFCQGTLSVEVESACGCHPKVSLRVLRTPHQSHSQERRATRECSRPHQVDALLPQVTKKGCMVWQSPLKFTPRGQPPLRVAINRGVLQKTSKNEWVQVKQYPYKTVGLCATTTSLQHPDIL